MWPRGYGCCALALVLAACGSRQAPSEPPVTVVAPAPADGEGHVEAEAPARATAPVQTETERAESSVSGSIDVQVDSDGGTVRISTSPDAGARVWGTFQRTDGGFTFQGGFAVGDAGAP